VAASTSARASSGRSAWRHIRPARRIYVRGHSLWDVRSVAHCQPLPVGSPRCDCWCFCHLYSAAIAHGLTHTAPLPRRRVPFDQRMGRRGKREARRWLRAPLSPNPPAGRTGASSPKMAKKRQRPFVCPLKLGDGTLKNRRAPESRSRPPFESKDSAALHTDVTRATCPRAPREMFKGLLIDVARDVPRRISYVRQRSAGALCIRGLRSRS
jgi:hypothetical protein